ncbi:MAG: TetR/AcrR family transcriptional regulator [Salinigranum sp.]
MSDPSADSGRSEAEEAIMRATYRALCEHGFADLTMQAIATEYGKTTAAIHYHYETKDDLVAAFLEYLLDKFVEHVHAVETTEPNERLEQLLDRLLTEREDHRDLMVAMLELRAQAPYNEQWREQLRRNDAYVQYLLRTVVADGVERGVFADVDADHAARALLTMIDGARTRYVALGEADALSEARRTAREYVDRVLRAE